MPYPLVPKLSGDNQMIVSTLLNSPARLNELVARRTAEQLIVDAFFGSHGQVVQGGALTYDVLLAGGDLLARDVETRAPGAEYIWTYDNPKTAVSPVIDFGGKVQILDEERDRGDGIALANKITKLANTIARKVDRIALSVVDSTLVAYSIPDVPGHNWASLTTVGPDTGLTPNSDRPTADFAAANLAAQSDDIGIGALDTLVCHPAQHAALKVGYGTELAAVLESAGIAHVRTSILVTPGTAYLVETGGAGVIAFERPLTTETIPDREHRATWVQSYAVPAFAMSRPGAVRRITGLAT